MSNTWQLNNNLERWKAIEQARPAVKRMALKLRRQYCPAFDYEELLSIADFCLCEAAAVHDPSQGASLTSLSYAYLWRTLCSEIRKETKQRNRRAAALKADPAIQTPHEEPHYCEAVDPSESPYQKVAHDQFRARATAAVLELSPLEQQVIKEVEIHAEKVAKLARQLGYSRGHLSLVRSRSLKKLRVELAEFGIAA